MRSRADRFRATPPAGHRTLVIELPDDLARVRIHDPAVVVLAARTRLAHHVDVKHDIAVDIEGDTLVRAIAIAAESDDGTRGEQLPCTLRCHAREPAVLDVQLDAQPVRRIPVVLPVGAAVVVTDAWKVRVVDFVGAGRQLQLAFEALQSIAFGRLRLVQAPDDFAGRGVDDPCIGHPGVVAVAVRDLDDAAHESHHGVARTGDPVESVRTAARRPNRDGRGSIQPERLGAELTRLDLTQFDRALVLRNDAARRQSRQECQHCNRQRDAPGREAKGGSGSSGFYNHRMSMDGVNGRPTLRPATEAGFGGLTSVPCLPWP
jgi:hypothetical protein